MARFCTDWGKRESDLQLYFLEANLAGMKTSICFGACYEQHLVCNNADTLR
jgi:hypothetical protein